MKKILSISVIALLTMVPTVGWAMPDNNAEDDSRVTQPILDAEQARLDASLSEENEHVPVDYVTARTSDATSGLNASHGYIEGEKSKASIVSNQEPRYNVEAISEKDGKDVAALSFVKGAYNDVVTKINKVYDNKARTANKVLLNRVWASGGEDAKKEVSLTTINEIASYPTCPTKIHVGYDYMVYQDARRVVCLNTKTHYNTYSDQDCGEKYPAVRATLDKDGTLSTYSFCRALNE